MPNQFAPPQATVRVNRVGRVLSGLYALWTIMGVTLGLEYYAESGLVSELVVDIISSIVALACLLVAFIPEWISRRLKIRLESGAVFALALIALIVVNFVAGALGPEPPGGWWNYGG
jgi:ABC-type transport system involved in cytochrome c biogenesis permease subunit